MIGASRGTRHADRRRRARALDSSLRRPCARGCRVGPRVQRRDRRLAAPPRQAGRVLVVGDADQRTLQGQSDDRALEAQAAPHSPIVRPLARIVGGSHGRSDGAARRRRAPGHGAPHFREPATGVVLQARSVVPTRPRRGLSPKGGNSMHTAPFVDLGVHHRPVGVSDRNAFGFTKVLRFCADTFFAKRYGHRAIVLETGAAGPGMVGATITHLKCLRRMCDDKGWIRTLMEEAENERMHLMTFIEVAKPTMFERLVILGVQWVFYLAFFALYLVSAKTAHRVVGYFEEEAVSSYTHYLKEIDEGRSANGPAPAIARHYWKLPEDATLRDVVLVVRADDAHHRDVNHGCASELAGLAVDPVPAAPYPEHADDIRIAA